MTLSKLTPLTRRRMADLKAGVILLVIFAGASFVVGFTLGVTQRHRTYQCPEIRGATPVITTDSKQGQSCLYVKSEVLYGKATHEVKL